MKNLWMTWAFSLGSFLFLCAAPVAGAEVVVMLGDSLTAMGGAWNQLRPGATVYNLGIGGDTTMGVWNRLDEAVAKKPQFIVLQVGINDVGMGLKPEAILGYHQKIWAELKQKTPLTRIILCSLAPVRESSFTRWPPTLKNATIKRINSMLAEGAYREGLTFVDLYSLLLGPDGELPALMTSDGVHLSPRAYQIWKMALKRRWPK